MTTQEKIQNIRNLTMAPWGKIANALKRSNDDSDEAVKLLLTEKQADAADIANRVADNCIVYSYVHSNKIGAMIVLACQTDFVAKNELFLQLAKDICMHIVSNPLIAEYIDENQIPGTVKSIFISNCKKELINKPENIIEKIVQGKLNKMFDNCCLLNQKFIKDDTKTIQKLIYEVASTVGEKIEIKKFIRMTTNG